MLRHFEFSLITEKLKCIEGKQLLATAFSCLHHLRSPLVLNSIEEKATMFHESWGRPAALSKPTWPRMKVWREQGRPLSLLALEAMVRCIPSPEKPIHKVHSKILQTNISEVESVLEEYRDKDAVPRVKMQVNRIVKYKDTIFLEGRGIMMFMRQELLRRGFTGPKFRRAKNGEVYVFEK